MWIARNKSGLLTLFVDGKPIRMNRPYDPDLDDRDYTGCWLGHRLGCRKTDLDESLFPNLTWEDEPQEVCICLNNEKYHTVKLEELNRLYEVDWKYQGMKEILESYQDMIGNYRKLPWYERIFKNI